VETSSRQAVQYALDCQKTAKTVTDIYEHLVDSLELEAAVVLGEVVAEVLGERNC